jgi:hypothetical protein
MRAWGKREKPQFGDCVEGHFFFHFPPNTKMASILQALPKEIILFILSFCFQSDLRVLANVCKEFYNNFCSHPLLPAWKGRFSLLVNSVADSPFSFLSAETGFVFTTKKGGFFLVVQLLKFFSYYFFFFLAV